MKNVELQLFLYSMISKDKHLADVVIPHNPLELAILNLILQLAALIMLSLPLQFENKLPNATLKIRLKVQNFCSVFNSFLSEIYGRNFNCFHFQLNVNKLIIL